MECEGITLRMVVWEEVRKWLKLASLYRGTAAAVQFASALIQHIVTTISLSLPIPQIVVILQAPIIGMR